MRVEDLTKFEGECPNIVVFGTYMDIRVPLTKKWKKIINERGDKPNTYHNCLISYISEQIAFAKQCREANKPKIVMLDEEGDDFAKQKHDEFYAYVKHHCPGFEDKIEWEYFQAYKTMPWNLSQQVKFWSNYGIAFK